MIPLIVVAYAFGFLFACIGLAASNEDAAQGASFTWLFPLMFLSSAYVPIATMPSWLQAFARNSPVTGVVDTVRALSQGTPVGGSLWRALVSIAAIIVLFVPLAVWLYRHKTR